MIILNPPKKHRFRKFCLRLLIVAAVLAAAVGIYAKLIKPPEQPLGYWKLGSYEAAEGEATRSCMAALPACGYCPGAVANGVCYVKLTEIWKWID